MYNSCKIAIGNTHIHNKILSKCSYVNTCDDTCSSVY